MQAISRTGRHISVALRNSTRVHRCSCCLSNPSLRTRWVARPYSAEAISPPDVEGQPKNYPPKIQKIVDEISELTLMEVADLNELLKKTLNITEAPMMPMGMPMPMQGEVQEEEEEVKREQTLFNVKLLKYDEGKKVALIKEIKAQVSGMNLVQAKKFVESVPHEVKTDISKEDAEKLKELLQAAGGTVEIE